MFENMPNYEIDKIYEASKHYEIIQTFTKKYNNITYLEFDYHVVHNLTLFAIDFDFDFDKLKYVTDRINRVLPSIKRIFSKPVLHLKENEEILPVESIKRINNDTLHHVAIHSELWDDITDSGIKPLKLLTKTYTDNYGIYENLVFCKTVDDVLHYLRTNIKSLKNFNYLSHTMEFDLLERFNHLNYFLALGKLHTGYIRNFDKYYLTSKNCLSQLSNIYDSILPRLKKPVYRKNKNRPKKIKIKKTNILSMHKDYKEIYTLERFLTSNNIKAPIDFTKENYMNYYDNYYNYCNILSIFSLGHFNYKCAENQKLNYSDINVSFYYKNWIVVLSSGKVDSHKYISFSFKKDMEYKIILVPSIIEDNEKVIDIIKRNIDANEYILCKPYEKEKYDLNECYIDISSIESFRRIQSIILRGMIYSDNQRTDCPFCNNNLREKEIIVIGIVYECESCRTRIVDDFCDETKKKYSFTDIIDYEYKLIDKNKYNVDDYWIYNRKVESALHFRNITNFDESMNFICPCCGNKHKNNISK